MKAATGSTLIHNGQLIDGTGAPPIANAAVVVTNGLIVYAGPASEAPLVPNAGTIDANGGTILPGLIEAHIHVTYSNVTELQDLDIKYPVDGLMDWNPDYRRIGMEGIVFIVNGPDEARAAVRKLVKDGVEWVKTYPTGDAASPDINDHHTLCMTFEEMHSVVRTAHNHGLKVTGHCRATEGIKNALRAGYDCIEHGTFIDEECLDLMLRRNVPMCPGLGFELFSVQRGKDFGLPQRVIDGHQETLEGGAESCRRVLKAGGTIGLGGDYGFGWTPHGTYAQELTFFVEYVGFPVLDTLRCATLGGAKIMGRAHEIGSLEKGKLADILVVDGDVMRNIRILEDRANVRAVMQGGIVKAGTLAKG